MYPPFATLFLSFFFFIYLFITCSMWACMFVWEEFMIEKRYSSMERRGDKTDDLVERSFHGVYRDSCSTTTNPQFLVCLLLSLLFFMFFFIIQHLFSLFCASFSSLFRANYLCARLAWPRPWAMIAVLGSGSSYAHSLSYFLLLYLFSCTHHNINIL